MCWPFIFPDSRGFPAAHAPDGLKFVGPFGDDLRWLHQAASLQAEDSTTPPAARLRHPMASNWWCRFNDRQEWFKWVYNFSHMITIEAMIIINVSISLVFMVLNQVQTEYSRFSCVNSDTMMDTSDLCGRKFSQFQWAKSVYFNFSFV